MKISGFFLIIMFLFNTAIISAQPFDMISVSDPVLEDLRFLSLVSGRPFLSFSPPLSPWEVRNFLDSIDENELSPPARQAYFRVQERLTPRANLSSSYGIFSAFFNFNSTVKARFRFNTDVNEYPQNPNIAPIAAFPVRMFFADMLQLYFEPGFSMRPARYRLNTFDLNIPRGYDYYDETMPLRAFGAAGGSWWNFMIGRDRLFWGTGHTGSLMFNDNSQYFDFARLSFFGHRFKYSLVINQLPLRLTHELFGIPQSDFNLWANDNNLSRSNHRYFYLHRFDFTISDRLSISIMEGVMVGDSAIELRYLNPLMIFHNFFSWEYYDRNWTPPDTLPGDNWGPGDLTGSILSIELNWNIINSLAVYGQFVMNSFDLPWYTNSPPNSLGYLAGIQSAHSFNNWASVFFLEFVYTDPFFGILGSPFASFIQQNRYRQYYFIGFPRDTISITLGARFFNNDSLNFSARFSWIANGQFNEENLIWNWQRSDEARNARTPTGIPEHSFILSLNAGWKIHQFVVLGANLTGIASVNNRHEPGKTAVGGQASLSVSFRY
ncbi:MAG: capsule assembly Wzi family protein [Treponema sp.]|nr:capsule assembly Wzi family protein [Treponema sp.]